MRMMLKVVIENQAGNEAMRSGAVQQMIGDLVDRTKPEATYFVGEDGQRGMLAVFDMTDSSQLPSIAEPLFQAGARVTFSPCMNLEDLQKAMAML
jgi:hypothetical protein